MSLDQEPSLEKESVDLCEWETVILEYDKEDDSYLNGEFGGKKTVAYQRQDRNAIVDTKQFVGIVRLPGTGRILKVSPKTASKYMDLLCYARTVKCNDDKPFFYYDFKSSRVDISEGKVFFEIVAYLFQTELNKIFRRGFYREYVRRKENMNFLRGKLVISEQVIKNYCSPKFFCNYFDLTLDNFVNQAILYAALKVSKLIIYDRRPEIRKLEAKIIKYVNLLKNEITIKDVILPRELIGIDINDISKKADHYRDIVDLTEIIIKESFFGPVEEEKIRCCNFLIDMNVVFERVVFGLLKGILDKKHYQLEDQTHYKAIGKLVDMNGVRDIIPDITILKDGSEYAVVDVKYKSSLASSDYYQIIIYSLVMKLKERKFKKAFLINFTEFKEEKGLEKQGFIKISKLTSDYKDIEVYQISIFLGEEEEDYISKIENQLEEVINENNLL